MAHDNSDIQTGRRYAAQLRSQIDAEAEILRDTVMLLASNGQLENFRALLRSRIEVGANKQTAEHGMEGIIAILADYGLSQSLLEIVQDKVERLEGESR